MVPLDRQIRYATGLQYDWAENVTLGAAYEYLDAGDAKIDQQKGGSLQGDLKGDYKANEKHFINLNLIWRFYRTAQRNDETYRVTILFVLSGKRDKDLVLDLVYIYLNVELSLSAIYVESRLVPNS